MISRQFSHPLLKAYKIALLTVAVLMSGFLVSVSVQAEETLDGTTLSLNDETFEGTINFIHSDSFMLIIDDYSFVLDRVIRFDGASWSREQVVQRLKQGDQVRLELGGVADDRSDARVVRSIAVLNQ